MFPSMLNGVIRVHQIILDTFLKSPSSESCIVLIILEINPCGVQPPTSAVHKTKMQSTNKACYTKLRTQTKFSTHTNKTEKTLLSKTCIRVDFKTLEQRRFEKIESLEMCQICFSLSEKRTFISGLMDVLEICKTISGVFYLKIKARS